MNTALEFHDSDVQRIDVYNDGGVHLYLPRAYIHRSMGNPGVDAGEGHWQRSRLPRPSSMATYQSARAH